MKSFLLRPHWLIAGFAAAGISFAVLTGFGVSSLVGCTSSGMRGGSSSGGSQSAQQHDQTEKPSGAPVNDAPHSYLGTASAGDFLSITVTPSSPEGGTIRYRDLSNGESGDAIPYAVNADGAYTIEDPDGNLVSAVEAPGYGLVVSMKRAGAEKATAALVTAVESASTTAEGLAGAYNYMQFRVDHGGVEIGSARISDSAITFNGYSPWRQSAGQNAGLRREELPADALRGSSDGHYMTLTRTPNYAEPETEYLSGAANGGFLLDTPEGAVIGVPQSPSSAFDAANAGTYSGLYYQKSDVQGTASGAEFGLAVVDPVAASVSASGVVTFTDSATGSTLATGTLTPACGAGKTLAATCNGLFTLRFEQNGMEQEVFISFSSGAAFSSQNGRGAILFSSFWSPAGQGAEKYSYFYGVGFKRS